MKDGGRRGKKKKKKKLCLYYSYRGGSPTQSVLHFQILE
jgi:hypothetical protein